MGGGFLEGECGRSMGDVHKYYYTDSVAGWSVYYTASLLYRYAALNYLYDGNNKCFLQMHLLAEALHSDIIPKAGVQSSGS